jgi:hypothetical protein
MDKHNRHCEWIEARILGNAVPPALGSRSPRLYFDFRRLLLALILSSLAFASEARAGSTINAATGGAAGTAVMISNSSATKLLNANITRYGWTVFCSGTSGTIAALVMPGDSAGNPANPAPSQTVGFPIPANTLVSNQDYPLHGLDALHQRIDAEAQGASSISCYTWEEQ